MTTSGATKDIECNENDYEWRRKMQRVKVNKSKQKRVILGFKKEQNGYLATESIYSTFSKSENKIKWFYDTSVSLCFHYQFCWSYEITLN